MAGERRFCFRSLPQLQLCQSPQVRGMLMNSGPLIFVVDDDESVRESLPDLLNEFGFSARAFSSAEEFLTSRDLSETKCLILDVAMPGLSGPELQQQLKLRRKQIPIVFITAHRDEDVRPRLIEQGAVECLFKPFSDSDLLQALNNALPQS
jgi:FixJ family two-component response regulator